MSDSSPDESVLRFRCLAVHRMYGQRFGLELDHVRPGVNVIAGPNGSGKTTLARAIEVLVWPTAHDWGHPIAEGVFQLEDDEWRVEVEASRVQYQKNGHASGQPSVPPPGHRDRYHLYLHDLLSVTDGSEQDLVEAILQEAQGGYDVPGAADALDFGTYAKGTLKETRELSEARRQVEQARQKQREIREEETSLHRLRRQRTEAREAAARRDALAQAIKLNEAEERLREAEEELREFPPKMDAVQGDEDERLATRRAEREEALSNKKEAEEEIADARDRIEKNRIPKDGLPDGTLETLRTAVQKWEQAQNTVDQAERERARAKEAEEQEWNRLTSEEREQVADLALPEIDRVQSLAESRLKLKGDEEGMKAMRRLFGEGEPEVDPETLRRGIEQLEEWLREPDPSADRGSDKTLRYVGIALSVFVALGGGVLAVGGALLGWGLAAVGVALAVVFYVLGRTVGSATRRPEIRKRFERLELDGPKNWSADAVHKHLTSLLQGWTDARLEEAKAEEWSRQVSERDEIEAKKEKLDGQEEEIGENLGVDPAIGEHGLLWFVQRLGDWQAAYTKVRAKEAEVAEAEAQVETWREKVQELTQPYGFEEIVDITDGRAGLEQLRDAQQDHRQARTALENAEDRVEHAENRIQTIDQKIEGIFDRLGISVGDDEAVEERCKRADDYEEVKSTVESAQQEATLEKERLQSEEGFEESMLSVGIEELERRKDAAASLAETRGDLSDKISRIHQKVESAKEEHDLEDALAECRAARERLERRRENDIRSVVGQALADAVHRRTRNQDLPKVFDRADELFRQITTDRYHLDLDRENSVFQVVTDTNRRLTLGELSSGTKVQLLLAVRIAFVERQEQEAKLPLVLDEALANSDDVKARSVIDAVRTVCREGRQVFYLTAQSDEVAKWQELLDGTETRLTVHALSEDDSVADGPFYQLGGDGTPGPGRPARPELPNPSEVSHAELGDVLDVPRWTPRLSVEKLALWYLTGDVELLCRAAEKSYRTWGQLSSLAERGGLSLIDLSDERYHRLEVLTRAVSAWREAWLIGRGDPVGRPALERTGAVSENFIEEVTDLAKHVDGRAERIIAELERGAVKRFRSDKIEELEAYFREEGYLSDREPLASEACWRRAIAVVSDEVHDGLIGEDDVESVLDRICGRAGISSQVDKD